MASVIGGLRPGTKLHANRYEIVRQLNSGATAMVYQALDLHSGAGVALKVLFRAIPDYQAIQLLKREANVESLIHPGIVKMLKVFRHGSENLWCIVSELVEGRDLLDTLNSYPDSRLPEAKARYYFCQLLEVIRYLHSMNICHRDIKAENIMIDQNDRVRVIDFGMSKHISSAKTRGIGTADYLAPELLRSGTYDGAKTDLWALGVTLYLMITGKYPFENPDRPRDVVATLKNVVHGSYPAIPPDIAPQELQDLVRFLLVNDPDKRATVPDVIASHWIAPYYEGIVNAGGGGGALSEPSSEANP